MIALIQNIRYIENKDWATFLFLFCFVVIAVVKSQNEAQFNEFLRLPFSKKYETTYRDTSNLYSFFTVALFIIQLISFSFLILIFLNYFELASKYNWITFIQIITSLAVFILFKFYFEKIIATAFDVEEFLEILNLKKVTYRAYIGFVFMPLAVFFYYNTFLNKKFILIFLSITGILMIYSYIKSVAAYQKIILSKLFYFILYLCTLEIGPYYFIYYWFTNK